MDVLPFATTPAVFNSMVIYHNYFLLSRTVNILDVYAVGSLYCTNGAGL